MHVRFHRSRCQQHPSSCEQRESREGNCTEPPAPRTFFIITLAARGFFGNGLPRAALLWPAYWCYCACTLREITAEPRANEGRASGCCGLPLAPNMRPGVPGYGTSATQDDLGFAVQASKGGVEFKRTRAFCFGRGYMK